MTLMSMARFSRHRRAAPIRVVMPVPREEWRALVDRDPDALAFQTPEWIDAIVAAGEHEDTSCLIEAHDGRRVILPRLRRLGLRGALAFEASVPFAWGFGGIVEAGGTTQAGVSAAFAHLQARGAMRSAIRPNPLVASAWSGAAAVTSGIVAVPGLAQVLDLSGGFAKTWQERFSSGTRNQARKASRSALVVEHDTTGRLIPVAHRLYLDSFERWHRAAATRRELRRQPPDSLQKFRLVADRLGSNCHVWLASLNGEPAAAIVVLTCGPNASYWRGAMNKAIAGPTLANYLLHHLAIEDACRLGCVQYHMGESGAPGLVAFKSGFGAASHPYESYRVERLPLTQTRQAIFRLFARDRAARSATISQPREP